MLLGIEVQELEIDGHKKTALQVERLNLWIKAYGAWRCSALPYWDASNVLEHVLAGRLDAPKVGDAGGGRVAAGTQFEIFFGDARECG